jgi:hypothetical protein
MIMTKTKLIPLFLILILSGCIATEPKQTYHYKDGSNLTLNPDNTFYIFFQKEQTGYSGAYQIKGNDLILTYSAFGLTQIFTKNGSAYIEADGSRWELAK